MSPLKLSTSKSLYKPIEIEIDGETFRAKVLTRAMLRKMTTLEKKIRGGDADGAYEQLEMIFGKHQVFDKLDLRQVNEIIAYVTTQFFKPEKAIDVDETEEEKNVNRPGDKKSV
jgi:hypothetical protein